MSGNTEFDYYIPPDVVLNTDGSIPASEFNKIYQFNDVDEFSLLSFTGMGMPPIKYIKQKGPFQHGETVLDYRLQPRTIQYLHRRNVCSRQNYWDKARGSILNALRPNRQFANSFGEGRLRKIQPDGTTRDINALIQAGPRFTARDPEKWDEWAITETIRFICHDPTWFDPELQIVTWDLDVSDGLLFFETTSVPENLTFPIVFSGDALLATQLITYTGTWLAYPEIEITGPVENPIITNTSTGEQIELTYNLVLGETVTINLQFGNKTVINNFGVNLIGVVTSPTDLATFHIAPDPEVVDGINIFSASGGGGDLLTTTITVNYHTRYIGI